MGKFKQHDITVKTAQTAQTEGKTPEGRVVKLENPEPLSVKAFEMVSLREGKRANYSQVKARFGSFAATDPDRRTSNQKDRRFSLHQLVRGPLSVEDEERRAIEERVRTRVAAVQDEARARANEAGFLEGSKRGYDEAYKKFQEEGAARLARLDALLGEAESAKEDIFRANERFLIELVYRVAKLVLLRDLTTDRDYVLRLTRELIERVGVRENIKLRIHPGEKDTIGMLKGGLEKAFGTLKNLDIEASPQVGLGGCILETEWNAIDASIQTQLDSIYRSLT